MVLLILIVKRSEASTATHVLKITLTLMVPVQVLLLAFLVLLMEGFDTIIVVN